MPMRLLGKLVRIKITSAGQVLLLANISEGHRNWFGGISLNSRSRSSILQPVCNHLCPWDLDAIGKILDSRVRKHCALSHWSLNSQPLNNFQCSTVVEHWFMGFHFKRPWQWHYHRPILGNLRKMFPLVSTFITRVALWADSSPHSWWKLILGLNIFRRLPRQSVVMLQYLKNPDFNTNTNTAPQVNTSITTPGIAGVC